MGLPQTIFGILGNVSAIGMFLSPIPTFSKIWKMKRTEDFSGLPYVVTLFNCLLWLFYGMPFVENGLLIMTINGFGTAVELLYISVFLAFTNKKMRNKMLIILAGVISTMILIVALTMSLVSEHSKRKKIVGSICVIIGSCMYASPLAIMKTVIKTASVQYMPLPLSTAGFFNGAFWTTYGILGNDIFVIIPNGLGTLLSAVQLALYAHYRSKAKPAEVAQVEDVEEDENRYAKSKRLYMDNNNV